MKKILRFLKCPPRTFAMIFGIISIAAVAFVFGFHYWDQPAAYVIYLCSAYGLYLIILNTIVPFGKYLVRFACLLRRKKGKDENKNKRSGDEYSGSRGRGYLKS